MYFGTAIRQSTTLYKKKNKHGDRLGSFFLFLCISLFPLRKKLWVICWPCVVYNFRKAILKQGDHHLIHHGPPTEGAFQNNGGNGCRFFFSRTISVRLFFISCIHCSSCWAIWLAPTAAPFPTSWFLSTIPGMPDRDPSRWSPCQSSGRRSLPFREPSR